MIRILRVYEALPGRKRGAWFLVDRLWPRGVKKELLRLDDWLPDVAPSPELRKWFGHDPARWEEFQTRYFAELNIKPERWRGILDAASRGEVTLLYSARDPLHNNARALQLFLARQPIKSRSTGKLRRQSG